MTPLFNLQGHRGARGLKPENTLPGFEVALDLGITSVETDILLTSDGIPVIVHDWRLCKRIYRLIPGKSAPDPASEPRVRDLSLQQLRRYRADGNRDESLFPKQNPSVTPLAKWFADQHGNDPYSPPTLAELFQFVAAYAGEAGAAAGKNPAQQERARRFGLDLELKRVPFESTIASDSFRPFFPGLLEEKVVEVVREANLVKRTTIRSFDHRSVLAVKQLEPRLQASVLVEGTAPVHPARLARDAQAGTYCPEFRFLDEAQVRALHEEGIQVLPWTVNDPESWQRLIDWGVDGITTDFPDQLARFLRDRHIDF